MEKLNVKNILNNFAYSLSSNFITLLISTIVVLIVPKAIGTEEYGFWQLYLFYSSYVGFFQLGWIDGIYLRYGGEKYENLNKKQFSSQFYSLLILMFFFSMCLFLYNIIYISDEDRFFILMMISVDIIVFNLRGMLILLLQTTNRIKDYAQINILDRIIYVLLIAILLFLGVNDYKLLVSSDIISKIISLIFAVYLCRDIVFYKAKQFKIYSSEILLNIRVGIKLMLSNIANSLIIGIARFGIEINWSVSTFGKVSLTLSVSNMFMTFINALGLVIYPVISGVKKDKISILYTTIRDMLMPIILLVLIVYYPVKTILSLWLPEYSESLNYMGLLLPIIIYQSKMSLLLNPFLKALRKEKMLLIINTVSVIFSIIMVIITTFILNSLVLSIFSIFLSVTFRGIIAELFISKLINITVNKDIILELIMSFVFIFTAYEINSWLTPVFYACPFIIYFILKRKDFIKAFLFFKKMSMNSN